MPASIPHNPSHIRTLLFDLGNVIMDIDIGGAIDRLRALLRKNTTGEPLRKALLDYECGHISTDIFLNTILSLSERHVQALDVIDAWNSMLIGIPAYRLHMLEALRVNYNVYLLSNTNALHVEWIHRYLEKTYGIVDFEKRYFDEAYYSHLIGDRKPNASIFRHIIDDSFLNPGATLFMDDLGDNIHAAQGLGFATYQVAPGEEIAEYLKIRGFY